MNNSSLKCNLHSNFLKGSLKMINFKPLHVIYFHFKEVKKGEKSPKLKFICLLKEIYASIGRWKHLIMENIPTRSLCPKAIGFSIPKKFISHYFAHNHDLWNFFLRIDNFFTFARSCQIGFLKIFLFFDNVNSQKSVAKRLLSFIWPCI